MGLVWMEYREIHIAIYTSISIYTIYNLDIDIDIYTSARRCPNRGVPHSAAPLP